jgi:hypothetical protein
MVSGCRVEGITRDFVTVSKLQNGSVILVRLPVKKQSTKKYQPFFKNMEEKSNS